MSVHPAAVAAARCAWRWQWQQLMGGLGPADAEGNYRRPASAFSTKPPLPAEANRPHGHVLIVGRSCPWAHRAWLTWALRGLADTIELLVVEPDPEAGRWRFNAAFEGCHTLQELYRRCGAHPSQRATVPVLVNRANRQIVVGESARLIELLNDWPAPDGVPDLEPLALKPAITRWRDRFQSAVNDGVYRCGADGSPAFMEADAPTDDELHALLQTVIARLMKMLTLRGVLVEDMGQTYLAEPDADGEEARTLRPLQAAAITYRIAFGPRAGQKVLTLRGAMPREDSARQPLCADIDGFSLHAAVRVEAHDRKRLEQLCRYINRPSLANERI